MLDDVLGGLILDDFLHLVDMLGDFFGVLGSLSFGVLRVLPVRKPKIMTPRRSCREQVN